MTALKSLNRYLLKYRYRLLIGIFITIISKVFLIQSPKLFGKSISEIEKVFHAENLSIHDIKYVLLENIILILGFSLISGIFSFLMRQVIIVMSRRIEFDLKNDIYQKYQRLSISFYKEHKIGDLINRITEDVNNTRMYFGPVIMYGINILTLSSIIIYQMFKISPFLSSFALLPFPLISFLVFKISLTVQKKTLDSQSLVSELFSFIQECFSGIPIIKSNALENEVYSDFNHIVSENKREKLSLEKYSSIIFPTVFVLIGLSNIAIIFLGGKLYIEGEIKSIGYLAEFLSYVNLLIMPISTLGWIIPVIQKAIASQKRIDEFFTIEDDLKPEPEDILEKTIEGSIELKKVSKTYQNTNIRALKDISFTLKKGHTLGIIGKVGAGKSTIVDLITGIINPDKGEIKLDDYPIESVSYNTLRKDIGVVPQDSFLFSDTIKNNILFGDASATDEDITYFAKLACIHDDIMAFKEGYNTTIGERGVTLSGGQKQRICIARALIKRPKILILDDCSSALDTFTENKLIQNIKNYSEDITTLIISHKISSVKRSDLIIVLENGQIIESGNHDHLLELKGFYHWLYQEQQSKKHDTNVTQ